MVCVCTCACMRCFSLPNQPHLWICLSSLPAWGTDVWYIINWYKNVQPPWRKGNSFVVFHLQHEHPGKRLKVSNVHHSNTMATTTACHSGIFQVNKSYQTSATRCALVMYSEPFSFFFLPDLSLLEWITRHWVIFQRLEGVLIGSARLCRTRRWTVGLEGNWYMFCLLWKAVLLNFNVRVTYRVFWAFFLKYFLHFWSFGILCKWLFKH